MGRGGRRRGIREVGGEEEKVEEREIVVRPGGMFGLAGNGNKTKQNSDGISNLISLLNFSCCCCY